MAAGSPDSVEKRSIYDDYLFSEEKKLSQEEKLLTSFFEHIGKFDFDRAKDLCGQDKDVKLAAGSPSWGSMLTQLFDLAIHEKIYYSLEFLEQKWFSRKESLVSAYESVKSELQCLLDLFTQHRGGMAPHWETKMILLCQQLLHFVSIRVHMVQYYHELSSLASSSFCIDYNQELTRVWALKERCGNLHFLAPMVSITKMIKGELRCLELINEIQIKIASCQFLEVLLSFDAFKSLLMSWNGPTPEVKRPGFLASSRFTGETQLHYWIRQFYCSLLAKALVVQSPAGDAKLPVELDLYAKLLQFQKHMNAAVVAVIFDTNGSSFVYRGHGYWIPDPKAEQPSGLSSYPAIVAIPTDVGIEHRPSVVCLLTEKSQYLDQKPNPLQFFDEKTESLYVVTKIEDKMYLLLIFKSRRHKSDSAVASFLSGIVPILRNTRQYTLLQQKKAKQ